MNKSFMRRPYLSILICAMWSVAWMNPTKADQVLSVPLDTAQSIRLSGQAKDVIIANPGIADVTLQAPDQFIIIAKQAGRTSLLILDANRNVLLNRMVVVSEGDTGLLTVRGPRGGVMSQDSYACARHCTLIPGTNVGGAYGGGSLGTGAGPLDTGTTPSSSEKLSKTDSKVKTKTAPNGDVTGTTNAPVYGTPPY